MTAAAPDGLAPVHVTVVLPADLVRRLDAARADLGLGRSSYIRMLVAAATGYRPAKATTSEGL